MDSKDHYVKECLVSKPPKMGNLASHCHEKLKDQSKNNSSESKINQRTTQVNQEH